MFNTSKQNGTNISSILHVFEIFEHFFDDRLLAYKWIFRENILCIIIRWAEVVENLF
jgi:hypothetical protein